MDVDEVFRDAAFLGSLRTSRKEEQKLYSIAEQLRESERVVAVLPVGGSTLVLTSDRLLQLRPHLEEQGMWNVRAWMGYEITWEVELGGVRTVHATPTAGVSTRTGDATKGVKLAFEGTERAEIALGPTAELAKHAADLERFTELVRSAAAR